jgi:hypothetical protein
MEILVPSHVGNILTHCIFPWKTKSPKALILIQGKKSFQGIESLFGGNLEVDNLSKLKIANKF